MKIMELEEELKVVASNLKSLEVSEEKANKREIANKEQVKTLTGKLKQAVARADFAERSVLKLNTEVGMAEDFQTCVTCVSSGIFHQRMLILTEIAGGPFGGGADEGAGEVEGDHRGAGAHLCRTFRILSVNSGGMNLKSSQRNYLKKLVAESEYTQRCKLSDYSRTPF